MHEPGLREYLHVLRRRKWIVLLCVVVVPLAAVGFSLRQSPLYRSSADVLLRYQTLPSTLSGVADPNSAANVDPARTMNTQLQIASLPTLAARVDTALRRRGIPAKDIGSTTASAVGDTDLLRFTSGGRTAATAAAIATEYARQFTRYRRQLDRQSITQEITGLEQRIATLSTEGTTQGRADAAELRSEVNGLQTILALQAVQTSAVVVRVGAGAVKVRPTPRKYALLGVGLGLVLGIGLAFLREAFDTRLRSGAQIGAVLTLPLLARVPAPRKRLARARKLVMIAEPTSPGADAFRRLRMNLEFASIAKPSQVVMLTSAVAQEGKSTTLANLGVALALAGKSVGIVDLDLHRPTQGEFFRLGEERPGLTSVVLGHVGLDEALVSVPLDLVSRNGNEPARPETNGSRSPRASAAGSLLVLPAGALPPDPGEFVGLDAVGRVIAGLRERVDIVLLDSPPLLAVGDGLTIAGFTDAILVVVRSDVARRPTASELAVMLGRLPAVKLGFVLCGEAGLDGSPYGYGGYGYGYPRGPSETQQREGTGVH